MKKQTAYWSLTIQQRGSFAVLVMYILPLMHVYRVFLSILCGISYVSSHLVPFHCPTHPF